jgi:hypothetical protein
LAANAPDATIVEKAWELQRTIVTGNGDDFIKEILNFQRQTEKKDCHEMFGVIILPNGLERQKRVLRSLEEKLRFGGKKVSWADVWRENYCVKVSKSGRPVIKAFPKCVYCKKREEQGKD